MALGDVTANGVERAMAEFDQLGRDEFLSRYGFRKSRSYFLVRDGRRYDSKAIVGVAHRYNHSDRRLLRAQEFSGGDPVLRLLKSLGFVVERSDDSWTDEARILVLDLYLRVGRASASSNDVKGLSDFLRALSDSSEEPHFRTASSIDLKLGNFAAIDPHYEDIGLHGFTKRDQEIWDIYAADEDQLAAAVEAIREGQEPPGFGEPGPTEPSVEVVPIEEQHVEAFSVTNTGGQSVAHRSEQTLVLAFRDYQESRGHTIERHRYVPKGSRSALYCDLVDLTDHVLYEAKSDVKRTSIRMAIGQLLDYRRFEQDEMELAILLPRKPTQDIIDLILSVPAIAVWRTTEGFENQRS